MNHDHYISLMRRWRYAGIVAGIALVAVFAVMKRRTAPEVFEERIGVVFPKCIDSSAVATSGTGGAILLTIHAGERCLRELEYATLPRLNRVMPVGLDTGDIHPVIREQAMFKEFMRANRQLYAGTSLGKTGSEYVTFVSDFDSIAWVLIIDRD
ncbi:MAG: hypothetical protein AB1705_16415 [Verrucomicrobiota bacterium]